MGKISKRASIRRKQQGMRIMNRNRLIKEEGPRILKQYNKLSMKEVNLPYQKLKSAIKSIKRSTTSKRKKSRRSTRKRSRRH